MSDPKSPYYEAKARHEISPRDGGSAEWQPPPPDQMLDTVLNRYILPLAGSQAQPIPIAYAYNSHRLTRVEVTNLTAIGVIIGTASADVQGSAGNGTPVYEIPAIIGAGRVFFLAPRQKFYAAGLTAGARVSVAVSEFPYD